MQKSVSNIKQFAPIYSEGKIYLRSEASNIITYYINFFLLFVIQKN